MVIGDEAEGAALRIHSISMEILGGDMPAFLRETGPLFEGRTILTISQIGPAWSAASHDHSDK